MKIVIIGTGNVASFFAKKLHGSSQKIIQVYSRNIEHANALAKAVDANPINNLSLVNVDADAYMIAVSDDAIASVIENFPLVKGVVMHTSGAKSINLFQTKFVDFGVLYPLQSINQYSSQQMLVPLLLEANNSKAQETIEQIAQHLTNQYQFCNSDDRLKLHVSAVLVNNFTNYLYCLSQDFCNRQQLDFNLLLPIIEETTQRLHYHPAKLLQTGPAKRQDLSTIEQHQKILEGNNELLTVYTAFTEFIKKSNMF